MLILLLASDLGPETGENRVFARNSPGRIQESNGVRVEGTRDWEEHGQLTKGMDCEEQHDTDDNEVNDQRSRATTLQC